MATCNKCSKEVYPSNSFNYFKLFEMKTYTGTETHFDRHIDCLAVDEREKIKLRLAGLQKAGHEHRIHTHLTEMLVEIEKEDRHFLPENNCEGSPSLAQYIEGQKPDTRPEWKYRQDYEPRVRRAYAALQEWCKQKTEVLC